MPIPQLKIQNQTAGLPRTPVALRYAILISGLRVGEMCALLTGKLHYYSTQDNQAEPLLNAYEITGGASASKVSPNTIETIWSEIPQGTRFKNQLKHIPKSFFVWSNDLAEAFQHYIDLVPGRENAHEWKLALNWQPALGINRPLIEECPSPKIVGSPLADQWAHVAARDKEIVQLYHQLKKQFPKLSKSAIAARIALQKHPVRYSRRVKAPLSPESIRRILNHHL